MFLEILKRLKHIALDVDEILQTGFFEDIGGAFGVTGEHHDGVILKGFEDLKGKSWSKFQTNS